MICKKCKNLYTHCTCDGKVSTQRAGELLLELESTRREGPASPRVTTCRIEIDVVTGSTIFTDVCSKCGGTLKYPLRVCNKCDRPFWP